MPRKTAGALRPGDKVKRTDTGEAVSLTYAGRGTIRGTVLIQWNEDGEDKRVHVAPDKEFEIL